MAGLNEIGSREEVLREEIEQVSHSLEELQKEHEKLCAIALSLTAENSRLKTILASESKLQASELRRAQELRRIESEALRERETRLQEALRQLEVEGEEYADALRQLEEVSTQVKEQKRAREVAEKELEGVRASLNGELQRAEQMSRELDEARKSLEETIRSQSEAASRACVPIAAQTYTAPERDGNAVETDRNELNDTAIIQERVTVVDALLQLATRPDVAMEDLRVVGSLELIPVSDLVAWAKGASFSGILSVSPGRTHPVEIIFGGGTLLLASIAEGSEEDRLGRILVSQGVVSETELQSLTQGQSKGYFPGDRLGDQLVKKGVTSAEAICAGLLKQTTRCLRRIMRCKVGSFALVTGKALEARLEWLYPYLDDLTSRMQEPKVKNG